MNSEIYTKVCETIQEKHATPIEISENSLLMLDLGMSSIQLIMLFAKLTDELGIDMMSFDDDELNGVKSVGDLTVLLATKLSEV